jgi:methylenetetrahydrofolate dehydrogenase (NADP+)/methenyltetrahydrofolate cyclohydrolase
MSNVVYGSELSKELKEKMKEQVDRIAETGSRVPCLAVVLAGENPASLSYVRGKEKACAKVGIHSIMRHLPSDVSQAELEWNLRDLSNDDTVDGILLQLPLPDGLDENAAISCINPDKDVDGLTPVNFGRLFLGMPSFRPCTPSGIMEILKRMNCDPDGKHAVVIGRSKLVGTPVARLLQDANATVTICHTHTRDLRSYTKQADILIAAVGKPKFFDSSYIKEGAYVVDVGVNRLPDGHLCGDVDFDAVKDHCTAITPVPKGVGPMTITMLLRNTITAFERKQNG